MHLSDLCGWLEQTDFSVWLREAPYPYPVLLMIHVLTIGVFGGMVLIGDLRLAGRAMSGVPASQVLGQFRPWKLAAFGILFITGILLSMSDPREYCSNIMYWISLLLLLLIGVNALVFRYGVFRSIAEWDAAAAPPTRARMAGWISLGLWVLMVLAGRAIAFF